MLSVFESGFDGLNIYPVILLFCKKYPAAFMLLSVIRIPAPPPISLRISPSFKLIVLPCAEISVVLLEVTSPKLLTVC